MSKDSFEVPATTDAPATATELRRKLLHLLAGGALLGAAAPKAQAAAWQSMGAPSNTLVNLYEAAHYDQGGEVPGRKLIATRLSGASYTVAYITYSTFNCNCNCTCVPAGTLVRTPQGLRPIERVAVGDLVITTTGIAVVERLWRPLLGNRKLWCVNGVLEITGDHLIKTEEGWACIELDSFARRKAMGLAPDLQARALSERDRLVTHSGLVRAHSIEERPASPELQLYSLVVSGAAEFFANDIVVDGIKTPAAL